MNLYKFLFLAMELLVLVCTLFVSAVHPATVYQDSTYDINLFSSTTYQPTNDFNSYFFPLDYMQRSIHLSTNFLFLLDSYNIVWAYNRS
jgi:hypothetical protein